MQDLYDSSRFNDDDDEWEQQQQQQEQQQVAAGSSGGPAPPAGLVLPRAKNTKVKTAEFIKSSVNVKDCPKAGLPEFAVIGRSNVGKSSLINMLTGRKSLAMVSKTPGELAGWLVQGRITPLGLLVAEMLLPNTSGCSAASAFTKQLPSKLRHPT